MDAVFESAVMNSSVSDASQPARACGRRDFHPFDEEDRKHDDLSPGIDWDEIITTMREESGTETYAFDSGLYPTEEAAMAALKQFIHQAAEEGRREASATYPLYR